MPKRYVVFHCPKRLTGLTSPTSVRPIKVLKALAERYEVVKVVGGASERGKAWKDVMVRVENGDHPLFLYSEPTTAPLNLVNGFKNYIFRYDMDWKSFSRLRGKGIPIGLFYRDAHWVFPDINKRGFLKKQIYRYEYIRDLKKIARFLHGCFLSTRQSFTIGAAVKSVSVDGVACGFRRY